MARLPLAENVFPDLPSYHSLTFLPRSLMRPPNIAAGIELVSLSVAAGEMPGLFALPMHHRLCLAANSGRDICALCGLAGDMTLKDRVT